MQAVAAARPEPAGLQEPGGGDLEELDEEEDTPADGPALAATAPPYQH